VVDLFCGTLDAPREPADEVIRVIRVELANVVDPPCRLLRISRGDRRGPVQVVAPEALALDPAALIEQPPLDDFRVSRRPR
jgi:hypothetical protein